MSDKGLIRQEIERRIKNLEFSLENNCVEKYSKLDILGNITTLESLLQFIDSLPEEPASEDLEEAANEFGVRQGVELKPFAIKFFKAGAEWQKQQMKEALQAEYEKGRFDMREEMMKDAVGGVVHHFADDEVAAVHYNDPKGTPMSIYVSSKELSAGDKVKIIIIKEELNYEYLA